MPHNNGIHPTANQRVSYRELVRGKVGCAAGDARRWLMPGIGRFAPHEFNRDVIYQCSL